jgi:hypothetical protein
LHLSIFYEYQHFFQHRICFSIQPPDKSDSWPRLARSISFFLIILFNKDQRLQIFRAWYSNSLSLCCLARPCTTLVREFEITWIKVYKHYFRIESGICKRSIACWCSVKNRLTILNGPPVVELLIWKKKSTIARSLTNSFQENLLLKFYNLCICDFAIDLEKKSWPSYYGSRIYNYLCNPCLSPLMLLVRISIRPRCTTICDKVCQGLVTNRWFSPGTPVSSTQGRQENFWAPLLQFSK